MLNKCILFFCLTFLVPTTVQSQCNLDRYQDLSKIRNLAGVVLFDDYEFEAKLIDYDNERSLHRKDRNSPPISITLSSSLEENIGGASTFSDVQMKYDVNFVTQLMKRKKTKTSEEILNIRTETVKNERNIFFVEKVILYAYSQAQLKIYNSRLKKLTELQNFLKIKSAQGDYVARDLSRSNLDIIALKNKILAVQTRLKVVKNELGVKVGSEIIDETSGMLNWRPKFSSLECPEISTEILIARANVELSRMGRRVNLIDDTIGVNLYGSHSLERWSVQTPTYGVAIEINLLAPKTRGKSFRQSTIDIDRSMRDLKLGSIRLKKLFSEQASVEELIASTISAIDSEISATRKQLQELYVRKKLGQSVFEEINSYSLELSNLEEIRLQRVYDLYNGWLQFLRAKGLNEIPNEKR